jgi:uncharacterized protein (DUF362 family)
MLEAFGLYDSIVQSSSIVIKPNLCAGSLYSPDSAVVTNPRVLELVIRSLAKLNPKLSIHIVESDSIGLGLTPLKYEKQGYQKFADRFEQVHLVDLSRTSAAIYPCSGQYFKENMVLPKIVMERDLFISLGKMKTHTNTTISGVLKNQFGCLPDGDKDKYHPYLPSVIADVNSVIKPDLCVIEGCPAMEGKGPVNGSKVDLDLLIFGIDPVAVDATMTRIMGFNPERISTLRKSHARDLGKIKEQDIEIRGFQLNELKRPFKFISKEFQFYIWFGFALQRFGRKIYNLGHLMHYVESTFWGIKKIIKKLGKKLVR